MIIPTPADIGREVIYAPYVGQVERGVLTSFNEHFAFVRYGYDQGSKATSVDHLHWSSAP